MKRFYKVAAVDADGGVSLDGRPVRTPARARLLLPSAALADAVAAEWDEQGETIDPRTMPLTGLANAAIDRIAPDPAAFVATLAGYAEGDVLVYRAQEPPALVAREAAAWDPILAWAGARYEVHFTLAEGIVHLPQAAATVERLVEALAARDTFALAGMAPLVTIGGSLVAALAVAEGVLDADRAFDATHLDELWQAERWGEDAQAFSAREARRSDYVAAARFLVLLSA